MPFRRVDIHAHTQFAAFGADRKAIIERALASGTAIINASTKLSTSQAAVALAREYPEGVYAFVGLHPIHTTASFHDEQELGPGSQPFTSIGEVFDPEAYRTLLSEPKVLGIGECGLDYFHLADDTKAKQHAAFSAQIALANETGKPLMLHIREAYDDALEILAAESRVAGDVHFFAGTIEQAKRFLDLGFTISFTGVVTFAAQYVPLVEYVPLSMIQAETDCPYVAPVPHRGKRNEPSYVAEIIARIATIKKVPLETVEAALLQNARRVWRLPC